MENELRLVYLRGQWAVCSQRVVETEAGCESAWHYAGGYFCLVGKEDYAWPLPWPESTNFQNDRFAFAVDRRHEWTDQWEKCGGADNMIAARGAFDAMVKAMRPNVIVRLRHGG